MDEIESIVRKWGDSVAIIIPKKIVSEKKVQIGDKIKISLKKKNGLRDLYGILNEGKSRETRKIEIQ